jgi:hypothetical protein
VAHQQEERWPARFQYQAAGVNLKSAQRPGTVSANRVMFQGEATINGGGAHVYVQAIDGDQAGQEDHFDIVIWEGTDTEAADSLQ